MTPIINSRVMTKLCYGQRTIFTYSAISILEGVKTEKCKHAFVKTKQSFCKKNHHENIADLTLTLSWRSCTPLYLFMKKKTKQYQLWKMTASWTFGHYLPGKFPLLAFPTPPQRKAAEQRVTDKRWSERGVLGKGRKWWRQKETDTSPVSNQRSCGAQFKAGMGQTSKLLELCHLSLPPPTFSKERKKENRGGRVETGGEERTKWKPDTQPCLVWMWAVGRMMSQIWSGIFSVPFHTFHHFSIYVCRASLIFQLFGDSFWFWF